MMSDFLPPLEKFDQRTERGDGCWEWVGTKMPTGYGQFAVWDGTRHRTVTAHRWAYRLFKGEIPMGLVVDHLCRNRGCVNPDHLEAVTHRENMRRSGLARTADAPPTPRPNRPGIHAGKRGDGPVHGRVSTYKTPKYACRCELCRAAWTRYRREQRGWFVTTTEEEIRNA